MRDDAAVVLNMMLLVRLYPPSAGGICLTYFDLPVPARLTVLYSVDDEQERNETARMDAATAGTHVDRKSQILNSYLWRHQHTSHDPSLMGVALQVQTIHPIHNKNVCCWKTRQSLKTLSNSRIWKQGARTDSLDIFLCTLTCTPMC
ncbi:hypothetical protein M441DRAFT_388693 [Trichoderma asperellum CBS 433.97]|uniref:Uncharacterized protein n=1 Tax=Trichoderma asperellum (strain ATCC 204424 / CBS 433.97 / NBRC 101777) TaxID=1042311 RepID=A0A2T3ZC20_TRIA4|nr:hypothetical protein M441DRAFT_388693 [Trichoderma asperellum CBS 433.97]PTB42351.1 hypothetical protein M441DRAFT_388693 [Trichoderma asperellum CBS 433.97]